MSGFPGSAAYAASKGAVISLTRQGAIAYAKQGIRINVICPGAIDTPLLTKRYTGRMNSEQASVSLAEEALRNVAKKYPMKSIGSADDVAQMAVFLASDESRWVTGSVFPVDGGFSAV